MPIIGLVLLGIVALLIMFGVLRNAFEHHRLNRLWSLIIVLVIIGTLFIPNIVVNDVFRFNIGGFIIPLIAAIAMMFTFESAGEFVRALTSIVFVAGLTLGMFWLMPINTGVMRVLTAILVGLVAGGISYLIGRSPRGAVMSSVLGIYGAQALMFWILWMTDRPNAMLDLGVGFYFDAIVIAAVTSFILVEVVRLARGSVARNTRRDSLKYESGEFHEFWKDDAGKDRTDEDSDVFH